MPYTNREITSEELEDARRAVTVYYISHGYINSGAVIPDQTPDNGVITIRIVEGALSRSSCTEISGCATTTLRAGYSFGAVRPST